MKRIFFISLILVIISLIHCARDVQSDCLTGAFLRDQPSRKDIKRFENQYGKKPYLVMIFADWGRLVDKKVITDIYSENCILFVTWEPWEAVKRKGINYDKILSGTFDRYIEAYADRLKAIEGQVFLRFAHEMNGDWYPWSGAKIGGDKYKAVYRYIKDIFDSKKVENVKWVFSINWQNVPKDNNYIRCYPGDEYVDYIGIDGYNWGNTQSWSKWMSFKDIFFERYLEIIGRFKKPILISEFSSTDKGGNKAKWIREAMGTIKNMQHIKGFVLFNIDKEVDWSFPINSIPGKELKRQLNHNYFRDRN